MAQNRSRSSGNCGHVPPERPVTLPRNRRSRCPGILIWVLAQHSDSDPRFQGILLLAFEKRFTAGELSADDLARLTDRVLLNSDRPQQYGTQFDWYAAEFKLPSGDALITIEANRNRLRLMPLNDYACMMTLRSRRLQTPGNS